MTGVAQSRSVMQARAHMSDRVLAIDFDGTIARQWQPVNGALDHLAWLHTRGYKIVVHTTKARNESGAKAVAEWLERHHVRYADVTALKPDALFYVDDRALRFTDWPDMFTRITKGA